MSCAAWFGRSNRSPFTTPSKRATRYFSSIAIRSPPTTTRRSRRMPRSGRVSSRICAFGCSEWISHASLYAGLTSVVDIRERGGLFALRAHRTHRAAAGFVSEWAKFRPPDVVAADWAAVEAYIDRLLDGRIDPRWYRREGVLHALL